MNDISPYRHVEVVRVDECASCERRNAAARDRAVAARKFGKYLISAAPTVANYGIWNAVVWWTAWQGTVDKTLREPPGWCFLAAGFTIATVIFMFGKLARIAKTIANEKPAPGR